MVEIDLEFAEQLRTARRNAGLSLAEASDGICSISYLSLIESGKRNANPRMARELAARMEIKLPTPLITAGVHPLAERAEMAYRAGGMQAAKKYIDRMDNAPEALLLQGLDAEENNKFEAAAEFLKRAFEAPFVSPVTKMSVALARTRVLRELGHIQHAISVGEHSLEEWRGYSDELTETIVALRGTIAGAYLEMGDFSRANELNDLALNKLPSARAKALNLWAKADEASEEGDFIESELLVREALTWARLAEQPRVESTLLVNLAFSLIHSPKSNLNGALEALDDAQVLIGDFDGNLMYVHTARALALAGLGKRDEALAEIERARKLVDTKSSISYSRFSHAASETYSLLGMDAEAMKEIEACFKAIQSIGASRTAAVMWRKLAEVYKQHGDKDKALTCLMHATDILGLDAHLPNFTAAKSGSKKR